MVLSCWTVLTGAVRSGGVGRCAGWGWGLNGRWDGSLLSLVRVKGK